MALRAWYRLSDSVLLVMINKSTRMDCDGMKTSQVMIFRKPDCYDTSSKSKHERESRLLALASRRALCLSLSSHHLLGHMHQHDHVQILPSYCHASNSIAYFVDTPPVWIHFLPLPQQSGRRRVKEGKHMIRQKACYSLRLHTVSKSSSFSNSLLR